MSFWYLQDVRELLLKATDWSKFEICHSVSLAIPSDDLLFFWSISMVLSLDGPFFFFSFMVDVELGLVLERLLLEALYCYGDATSTWVSGAEFFECLVDVSFEMSSIGDWQAEQRSDKGRLFGYDRIFNSFGLTNAISSFKDSWPLLSLHSDSRAPDSIKSSSSSPVHRLPLP